MFQTGLIRDSCLISVAGLSLSTALPKHVEAVLCSLYSYHAAAHTKISTNTPTEGIKRTGYSTALFSTLSVLAFFFLPPSRNLSV